MAGKKEHHFTKITIFVLVLITLLSLCIILPVLKFDPSKTADAPAFQISYSALPAPEIASGERGLFGIDRHINESTIDNYLDRPNVVYRDVRLLEDPANYAAIGGDSNLTGFIRGFEVVPYPYLASTSDLPDTVGEGYNGPTLFTLDETGNYRANYAESLTILETLFPKDKAIFLMCGGGGYAEMTKQFLLSLGWDGEKIYNVGGYWNYHGDNAITVQNNSYGDTTYDFWKIPYHAINFDTLHALKTE